ncbi:MAG: relaxase/mobilization nuclease domain-containing protein [Oscillospiraceae bacterium]|nr:relaxase/mobilization nuclease domain-containing protein [Oscillospiraceae bacterium]
MPILKSICVHSSVNRCLRYILNPDKTEDLLYTASLNCLCDVDAAYLAMKMIYEHYSGKSYDEPLQQSGKNRVKAIHYIQSFSSDENITPEQAHRIAKAFVRKTFGDDVQVVIATHCDKAHVHSHIVINSYSVTGRKYYDNWNSREHAREYSDRVCQAFGIKPLERRKGGKGIKYNEWEHHRRGTSWKQQICTAIDSLIPSVKDIDELYAELTARGYEIKHGKYTAIRAEGQQRFVRLKTLGEDYTEDNLRSRILWRDDLGNALLHSSGKALAPIQSVYVSAIERLHVLINEAKKIPHPRNSDLPYLPNNDRDVYIVSAQLSILNRDNIGSIEELKVKMTQLKEEYETAMKEINALTAEQTRLEGIISQAEQYFSLLDKPKRSEAEEVMLNLCKRTVLNNSIHYRNDLYRLKKTEAEQDARLSELRKSFEQSKKQYEVYRDISDTYRDISTGDYISRLMIAEKEKQEETQKQQTAPQKKKGQRR